MNSSNTVQTLLAKRSLLPILGLFIFTLTTGLVVNYLLAHQQTNNSIYAKYSYQLAHATQISRTQAQSALEGNSEALRYLQEATEDGIFSLNTLTNGNLKLDVSSAPNEIQSALEDFAPLWKKISSTNSSILQNRSQIQSLSDKKDVIRTSMDKLVELEKSVIEALLLNNAPKEQLQVAINQLSNIYHFQSKWQSIVDQSEFNLRSMDSWQSQFESAQKALLSGQTTPPVSAIKDPQVRRLVANVSTQFESMASLFNELKTASKQMQVLQEQINELKKSEHEINQQIALLINTADQLNDSGWIQSWYIFLILLIMGGLYIITLLQLVGSTQTRVVTQPSEASNTNTFSDTSSAESTNTVSNRRKAAFNQLINEIRPLGEGKLYFDVTDSNEHTREIAEAYNQSKARLIQRCIKAKKQAEEAQKSIFQQLEQAQDELTNEIKLVSEFKESIPLLLSQLSQGGADSTNLTPTLELANKIRARLSLTKEKLHKLSKTEPSTVSEKTFKAFQDHLSQLVTTMSDAELEQEQINILLRDHCKQNASDGRIEGDLKEAILAFNPQLSEISVTLNSLESRLIDTNRFVDSAFKQLSVLELDRGLR